MTTKQSRLLQQKFYWPWLLFGLFSGLVLSWGVLTGDDLGRINLLYMLLLYCLVPILTLVASIFSLFSGRQMILSKQLLQSNMFKIHQLESYKQLRRFNMDKYWLLQQGQLFALAFSLASILVFLFLLTFTDVSFIWRSTILSPEQLLPIMEWLATPWWFWSSAQPDLALLQASQNFRLEEITAQAEPGRWWPFVLAVQVTYSLLPRLVLYFSFGLKLYLMSRQAKDMAPSEQTDSNTDTQEALAQSEAISILPTEINYMRWDDIPETAIERLKLLHRDLGAEIANPWSSGDTNQAVEQVVILLKSWEPPMAELADYLAEHHGFLLPLNWQEDDFKSIEPVHLEEWQRFARANDWRLVTITGQSDG